MHYVFVAILHYFATFYSNAATKGRDLLPQRLRPANASYVQDLWIQIANAAAKAVRSRPLGQKTVPSNDASKLGGDHELTAGQPN